MSVPSRLARTLAPAALAAAALTACRGSDPLTAPEGAEGAVPAAVAVAPDLLAALDDADARVAPALAAPERARLRAALAALRGALTAGDAAAAGRAVAAVRALAEPAAADASAADLAAVGLLADVTTRTLATPARPAEMR